MRHFVLAVSVLTAAASPAVVAHHAHAFASVQAAAISTTAPDSTLCGALHEVMHGTPGHAAPDAATMAALHSLMSAPNDGTVTLDSAQMAAIHEFHAQLMHVQLDSATHESLKALMHPANGDHAQADSAHIVLHNAMMSCMQHG